ncbi:hypothetical protein KBC04_03110 [Candidatus Babeliales bacterium]|nr:hypothetical protein [Candidatus Babeliales bacterium]MBP9843960.1 hypothetical protein [Candidatus Babeliales bacterium]
MKKLLVLLLLNSMIGKNICAYSDDNELRMLREYFDCTERVKNEERFLGIHVRLALADCTKKYRELENERVHNMMNEVFESNRKEMEKMAEFRAGLNKK